LKEKIKQFWESRAEQYSSEPAATTDDVYLRELEVDTLIQEIIDMRLPKEASILDVGCGNGYSTLKVAQQFDGAYFYGIDYSSKMIESALEKLHSLPVLKDRVSFSVGDVNDIGQTYGEKVFDLVVTDRCLINLDTRESQAHAIGQIAKHTKPQGRFLAIENFIEGHDNMNKARQSIGLPEIPVRWHNLYFDDPGFLSMTEPYFEGVTFNDFSSSYYFATRVVYSGMCHLRGEKIDYNHDIHRLATRLPWTGRFSPIRMAVMRRRAAV